ncbi:MAG: hypothetical protein U0610_05555 [bacterium]
MAGTEHAGATSYEKRDVSVRPVVIITGAILVAGFVVMIPVRLLFVYFHDREQARQPEPVSVTRSEVPEVVPAPRLEPKIGETLAELRAHERERLGTYEWIDKSGGVVRIPIDRAIEVVASEGLPVRQGAQPYQRFAATNRGSDGAGGSDSRATVAPAEPKAGHE